VQLNIIFPESLTIEGLESAVSNQFALGTPQADVIRLDLSRCEFIDIPSLLHIIALVAARSRLSLRSQIRLPKSRLVRDFLRVWDFSSAVRNACGIPLIQLVSKEDHTYFGESTDEVSLLRYASENRYSLGVQRLLNARFFSITTFLTTLAAPTGFARLESSRWQEALVRSVLAKYLKGPDGYVASRIIFEAATNAVRHPGAQLIQTASSFIASRRYLSSTARVTRITEVDIDVWLDSSGSTLTLPATSPVYRLSSTGRSRRRIEVGDLAVGDSVVVRAPTESELSRPSSITAIPNQGAMKEFLGTESLPEGYLTIVFWDDGQSMIETLRDAIRSGKDIRSIEVPELYANYEVLLANGKGETYDRRTLHSSIIPDRVADDSTVLLATTFPGITRDVTGAGKESGIDAAREPKYDYPGMGLYVLVNTVVDVFSGSVYFRTNNLGMSIRRSNLRDHKYRVKVRHHPVTTPSLMGNLITIRLPIYSELL
jgi:hypothetical protein